MPQKKKKILQFLPWPLFETATHEIGFFVDSFRKDCNALPVCKKI